MKITDLTYLIFEVNSAIDTGQHQDVGVEEVKGHIREGDIIPFLQERLGKDVDLSLFDGRDTQELIEALQDIESALGGRERRKMLVERSGLCLLIAYATELIQRRERK